MQCLLIWGAAYLSRYGTDSMAFLRFILAGVLGRDLGGMLAYATAQN